VYCALSILAFVGSILVYGQAPAATVDCHVCMGRDLESCTRGRVKCAGSCYKVVDTKHDLITKGCTLVPDDMGKTENSNWQPEPPIFLYWTNLGNGTREHVRGHGYFCKDKEKTCNQARRNSLAFTSLFFSLFYIFIAVLYR